MGRLRRRQVYNARPQRKPNKSIVVCLFVLRSRWFVVSPVGVPEAYLRPSPTNLLSWSNENPLITSGRNVALLFRGAAQPRQYTPVDLRASVYCLWLPPSLAFPEGGPALSIYPVEQQEFLYYPLAATKTTFSPYRGPT